MAASNTRVVLALLARRLWKFPSNADKSMGSIFVMYPTESRLQPDFKPNTSSEHMGHGRSSRAYVVRIYSPYVARVLLALSAAGSGVVPPGYLRGSFEPNIAMQPGQLDKHYHPATATGL